MAGTLPVQVHFSAAEFADRRRRLQEAMTGRGIDCLLITRLEDQYWLAGFDSGAASVFHVLFFKADGTMLHLSRSADLGNIGFTSQCRDVRVVDDRHGWSRGMAIRDALESLGCKGGVAGVETDSVGMPLALHQELTHAVDGWCALTDSSQVIRGLRRVKSAEELAHMRRAGEILAEASATTIDMVRPGVSEGDLMAEFQKVVYSAGGEVFAGFPHGSGKRAMLVRPVSGRGTVGENDQVLFEPGAAFRHYCVATMYSVLTGPVVDPRHRAMHDACVDALEEVQSTIKVGATFGDLYEAHRSVMARHGFEHAALQACGYNMGAVWETTWMEPPFMAADVPLVLEEHMTIFTHMILLDRSTGLSMALGETVEVTTNGPSQISTVPRAVMVK
ncbi:Xaa-Pro dipeptidase [Rhodococcus sp. MEB064]|nr:Xaa-Pro dipeptidase [Rhodococcus sp. MEB064]